MELRDLGRTLARWWYLTLITALVALGAAIGLYKSTGPTYQAQSTVVLLPPPAVIEVAMKNPNGAPRNPLLYLASLTDSRDMLVRAMNGRDGVDAIEKAAPNATVTVAGDATSNSPLIVIKSDGSNEADALAGVKAVNDLIPKTLDEIQKQLKIEKPQLITSMKVTSDSRGTAQNKKALTLGIVGFGGTMLLGLALIALIDGLVRRRRENGQVTADDRTANSQVTDKVN